MQSHAIYSASFLWNELTSTQKFQYYVSIILKKRKYMYFHRKKNQLCFIYCLVFHLSRFLSEHYTYTYKTTFRANVCVVKANLQNLSQIVKKSIRTNKKYCNCIFKDFLLRSCLTIILYASYASLSANYRIKIFHLKLIKE